MNGNRGIGRGRMAGGLALLLTVLAPATQAQDGLGASLATLSIESYVLFQAKWPEQSGSGGFASIYITTSEASSGLPLLKQSNSKVSFFGNCPAILSFPRIVHFDGPSGTAGVDLYTSVLGTTMYTRTPDPTSSISFSLSGSTWYSARTSLPGVTYVGRLNAANTIVWPAAGYYTGAIPVTVIPQ